MADFVHTDLNAPLALSSAAVTGVALSVGTLALGLGPWAALVPLGFGAAALLGLRATPIGRSMIEGGRWHLRYGQVQYDLHLSQIRQVTLYPGRNTGDRVFVHLCDGCVLPLPDAALPPLPEVAKALRSRGVLVVETD